MTLAGGWADSGMQSSPTPLENGLFMPHPHRAEKVTQADQMAGDPRQSKHGTDPGLASPLDLPQATDGWIQPRIVATAHWAWIRNREACEGRGQKQPGQPQLHGRD